MANEAASRRVFLAAALLALAGCGGARDPEVGTLPGSPLDRLPPEVTQLTDFGLRADWSPDGRRIVFLDALAGDVWAYELETKSLRKLTAHFEHAGFSRVHHLSNGDLILCGPIQRWWADPGPEARVVSVLLDELRAAQTAPMHLPMPRDPRALRVAAAFREDPSSRRSIRDWAKIAGTSERTFERLWSAEVDMTFGRWQQQARLLRALEVLASERSVTQAAFDVGFETPSAFIAMFRRAVGTTPARYFRDNARLADPTERS